MAERYYARNMKIRHSSKLKQLSVDIIKSTDVVLMIIFYPFKEMIIQDNGWGRNN